MHAYEEMLRATSRSYAPWYAIPADSKPYMRMCVAELVVQTLKALPLKFPEPSAEDRARMLELRGELDGS
jgi:hypothetical protein